MIEEWKDVPGYEGRYKVSDQGRVMTLLYKKPFILSAPLSEGYPHVSLRKDGKSTTFRVHTLVANAFIDNPLGLSDVNHIDGDKLNSTLVNLERVTRRGNATHSQLRLGRKTSKYPGVSFSQADKKWIAALSINGICKKLGQFDNEDEAYQTYLKTLETNNLQNEYAILSYNNSSITICQ